MGVGGNPCVLDHFASRCVSCMVVGATKLMSGVTGFLFGALTRPLPLMEAHVLSLRGVKITSLVLPYIDSVLHLP